MIMNHREIVSTSPRNAKCKKVQEQEGKLLKTLHKLLGHPSLTITKSTASANKIRVKGQQFGNCEHCLVWKKIQKKVAKSQVQRSKTNGKHLFMDILSPKTRSLGGSKHWLLIVDNASNLSWSHFLKKKSNLCNVVICQIKEMKEKFCYVVKFIRCDNAGENKHLERKCKNAGLNITFEYTSPGTPQYNGRVERKFATIYGRVRSMMEGAGFNRAWRGILWAEAAKTATYLDGLLMILGEDISPMAKFYKNKKYRGDISILHTFGQMCVARKIQMKKSKIRNQGKLYVFLGYPSNHTSDTYRLLTSSTQKVVVLRDVIFLGKSYGKWTDKKHQRT